MAPAHAALAPLSGRTVWHTSGAVTLTRRWKIALLLIGLVIALWLAFSLFNWGDVVPGTGEGEVLTALPTP